MKKERFSLCEFKINSMVSERIKYLNKIKTALEAEYLKMPEGNLTVGPGSTPNSFRYYNRENKRDKNGTYLNKESKKFRDALAQKKYYSKLIEKIDLECKKLNKVLLLGIEDSIIHTYKNLNPGIRKLIVPVNVDDNTMADIWLQQPYQRLGFQESDTTEFYSEKGERMRSKSEVLIANALYYKDIPYKYECPLELQSGKIKYPDFTILNTRLRKVYYWEHLGMIGDIDYVNTNIKKISEYNKEGICLGDNLIISYELGKLPLGTKEIERIIETYFLHSK